MTKLETLINEVAKRALEEWGDIKTCVSTRMIDYVGNRCRGLTRCQIRTAVKVANRGAVWTDGFHGKDRIS